VFDLDDFPFSPSYGYLRSLIFCGSEIRPRHVLIGGEFVVKDYEFVWGGIDEREVYEKVREVVRARVRA
jgi:hypothetical protein